MLALMRFGRATLRRKVEDWCSVRHSAIGITSCFAAPRARGNYVKVWLVALSSKAAAVLDLRIAALVICA